MQQRHQDRALYFREQAQTCRRHYLPYLQSFSRITPQTRVLEVGCGEGGNLLPFAQTGCHVTGIDLAAGRIEEACRFFSQANAQGTFLTADIFQYAPMVQERFDIIVMHDVIEHIADKEQLLRTLKDLLAPEGVLFIAFPAWQMPFGGHQQICHHALPARLPFIHLLPHAVYRGLLRLSGESEGCINELTDIRSTRTTIGHFEKLARQHFRITDRQLWFINPHYETKFGLRPRKLWKSIGCLPVLNDFFSTACWYLLTRLEGNSRKSN